MSNYSSMRRDTRVVPEHEKAWPRGCAVPGGARNSSDATSDRSRNHFNNSSTSSSTVNNKASLTRKNNAPPPLSTDVCAPISTATPSTTVTNPWNRNKEGGTTTTQNVVTPWNTNPARVKPFSIAEQERNRTKRQAAMSRNTASVATVETKSGNAWNVASPTNNHLERPTISSVATTNQKKKKNGNAWNINTDTINSQPERPIQPTILKRENSPKPIKTNSPQSPPKKKAKKQKLKKPSQQVLTLGDLIVEPTTSSSSSKCQPTSVAKPAVPPPKTTAAAATTPSHLNSKDFPVLAVSAPAAAPKPKHHAPKKQSKSPAVAHKLKGNNNSSSNKPKKDKVRSRNGLEKKKSALLDQPLHALPRDDGGTEHDLFKLMLQQKDGGEIKKGRQRIHPRKKKFTTLKKKVLRERLEKWNAANPQQENIAAAVAAPESTPSNIVSLHGFASAEELEDLDEYQEVLENLQALASKIGVAVDCFIDDKSAAEKQEEMSFPAFVVFENARDAEAACACWNGLLLGGQHLEAKLVANTKDVGPPVNDDDVNAREEWRQSIVDMANASIDQAPTDTTELVPTTIALANVLTADDLEDQEELEESLKDVRAMAEECGTILQVQATPDGLVLLTFETAASANNAIAKFSGMVVGGQALSAVLYKPAVFIVVLENVLTSDDLEDEDCLQESLTDLRTMGQEHGTVVNCQIDKENGTVLLTYENEAAAQRALEAFSGMVVGGQIVSARRNELANSTAPRRESIKRGQSSWIVLKNVLTEDDLEDEDCLEEAKSDIVELAGHHGRVQTIEVDLQDGGQIKIQYEGDGNIASLAASKFDGMIIGGQTISARVLAEKIDGYGTDKVNSTSAAATKVAETTKSEPTPMFSGDKLIPDRFAECKRVPKIPNTAGGPRHYAILTENEKVKPLLVEMLGELMRLQKRAMEDKNAKARRRIVMGLREVARGIRAHKVKMVVMANNLDEYGVIDEKLQAILDLARQEDVPIFFEFSKRTLGRALGKSIKVAVAGIQSADGAHQQYKKLVALAPPYT